MMRAFFISILLIAFLATQCNAQGEAFWRPPTVSATRVLTLHENVEGVRRLITASCTANVNNHPTILSGEVTPATGCSNCFLVLPTNWAAGQYEINYYASDAALNTAIVKEYTLRLTCSDRINGQTNSLSVFIRIVPNSRPVFDPDGPVLGTTFSNVRTTPAGTIMHSTGVYDPDAGDEVIFSMTSTPASSNFDIDANGNIVAENDLIAECNTHIDFTVTATDGRLSTSQFISVDLENTNQVPEFTNLPATGYWPEDTGVGTSLFGFGVTDDNIASISVTYTTLPTNAYTLFDLQSNTQLFLAGALDYETAASRIIQVIATVTDGYCSSSSTYTVSVMDVNEPPVIEPENKEFTVYEGLSITTGDFWTTTDPDIGDTLTYSITGQCNAEISDTFAPEECQESLTPTTAPFTIDPDTGVITNTIEYDVDQGAMPTSATVTVQVTDSGGLFDTTTVIFHILDVNDNRPVFSAGSLNQHVVIDDCVTSIGTAVGSVTATDDDSDFDDNNVITYSVSGSLSANLDISDSGTITVVDLPPTDTATTFDIIATDHGSNPGTLTSVVRASFTLTVFACPTTTSTTTTTTTTTPTTTVDPTNTVKTIDNLWWIILSGVLGLIMLALLTWLCIRNVGPYCANPRIRGFWKCNGSGVCVRKKPKVKAVQPRPMQPVKPMGNAPERGNAGFWKERFKDDDYKTNNPNRDDKPEPADYDGNGDNDFRPPSRGRNRGSPLRSDNDLNDPLFKRDNVRVYTVSPRYLDDKL